MSILHADYNRPVENEDRLNLLFVERYNDATMADIADIVIDSDMAILDDIEYSGLSEEEITDLVEEVDNRIALRNPHSFGTRI